MKFTKKSILAILLACICTMSCFAHSAHSYVNADDNAQPLATPAIDEPAGEIIDEEPEDNNEAVAEPVDEVAVIEYVYVLSDLKVREDIRSYVGRNQYGGLVKLRLNFANSENYGTDEIRRILKDLLGNIEDEQYASDDMFYDFTNTERGDKVLFTDKYPLPKKTDLCDPCYDFYYPKLIEMAQEKGEVPSLDGIYVKQDTELVYLTDEQYDKIVESGICLGTRRYSDYIGRKGTVGIENEKLGYKYIYRYDACIFSGSVWYSPYTGMYEDCYNSKPEGYFAKWYDETVVPYIVE